MAEKTLTDVVNELATIKGVSEDTTKSIDALVESTNKFMNMMDKRWEQDKLNNTEEKRERKVPKRVGNDETALDAFKHGALAGAGFSFLTFLNPAKIATLVGAGALAVIGATEGMRGTLPFMAKALNGIRKTVFKTVGLTADGLSDGLKGLFSSDVPIFTRIINAMSRLENGILKFFGVSTEGALLRDASGKFIGGREQRVTVVSRITSAISKLLSPLGKIAKGIDDWILGPGAKVLGFFGGATGLASAGGFVAGVAKLANKILLPIGFLISAWEAFTAWESSEEANSALRFIDSIGVFLGDFIGAPLDLLKRISAAILDWIGLQDAAEWLRSFSFEEIISDSISGIARFFINLPEKVLTFIQNFDMDTALETIKTSIADLGSRIAQLFSGVFLDIGVSISKYVLGITEPIRKSISSVKNDIVIDFENTIDSFKIGFMKISNFIRNIPDKLISLITGILDFEIPKLTIGVLGRDITLFPGGKPFGGIAEFGAEANNRIEIRNDRLNNELQRIEANIAERLKGLSDERSNITAQGNNLNLQVVAPTTNNSSQTTQTNISANPSPFNDRFYEMPQ